MSQRWLYVGRQHSQVELRPARQADPHVGVRSRLSRCSWSAWMPVEMRTCGRPACCQKVKCCVDPNASLHTAHWQDPCRGLLFCGVAPAAWAVVSVAVVAEGLGTLNVGMSRETMIVLGQFVSMFGSCCYWQGLLVWGLWFCQEQQVLSCAWSGWQRRPSCPGG